MMDAMGGSMGGQMGNMGPTGYGAGSWGNGYPGYADGMIGGAHGAANGVLGFDVVSLLTGLLNFAISILVILFVVGLIVAVGVFLKRYLLNGNSELAGIFTTKTNSACTKCGASLQSEWRCCPKCGEAKFTVQPHVSQTQTV